MEAADIAQRIMTAQRESRSAKHASTWAPTSTPASALGNRCARRLVYQRTIPEAAEPISEELASIFEEGNHHEAQIRRELSEIGFEVVEAESSFRDDRLEISGRIDGKIQDPDDFRNRIPVEIKGISGNAPKTAEEWKSAGGLMSRYYSQLQIYLFLTSSPSGLGLFKSKMLGLWTVVAVDLDYPHVEELLRRAEEVRDCVKGGNLPAMLPDRSECGKCPWRATCLPGDAEVDATQLAEDDALLAELDLREELEAAAVQFKRVDAGLKERFKLTKGDRFVVSAPCDDAKPWLVTKRPHGKGTRIIFERMGDDE